MLIDRLLNLSEFNNGEKNVALHSIIVHETATGYAQCFREDAYNPQMGEINLNEIKFSDVILDELRDKKMFEKLIKGEKFAFDKDC